jgi:hypothetical protein
MIHRRDRANDAAMLVLEKFESAHKIKKKMTDSWTKGYSFRLAGPRTRFGQLKKHITSYINRSEARPDFNTKKWDLEISP